MVKKFIVALVTTSIVITSCGGALGPGADSVSPTNSSGVEFEISVTEAAQKFVNMIVPTECLVGEYRALEDRSLNSIDNPQSPHYIRLVDLTQLFRQIYESRQKSLSSIRNTEWPRSVQIEIEQLLEYWNLLENSEQVVANVNSVGSAEDENLGTWVGAIRQWSTIAREERSALPDAIRIKLLLPEFSQSECP